MTGFLLNQIRYIKGKIPRVLKIQRIINHASWSFLADLQRLIYFSITSRRTRTPNIINTHGFSKRNLKTGLCMLSMIILINKLQQIYNLFLNIQTYKKLINPYVWRNSFMYFGLNMLYVAKLLISFVRILEICGINFYPFDSIRKTEHFSVKIRPHIDFCK